MDVQPAADAPASGSDAIQPQQVPVARRQSSSQASEDSQTAADFLRSQLQLEAEAREALPYSIEHCTKPLGRLRQSVFACLTCNPPPALDTEPYTRPAGVCYACSVQCHGEHTLVEIFTKRNFVCDCGTTRFPDTSPCSLRINEATGTKGNVHADTPDAGNHYNHNFRNRFCGCACDYDPFEQKGTMFQCLGLGTNETGGCGEDWWHPGCVVGQGSRWFEHTKEGQEAKEVKEAEATKTVTEAEGLSTITEEVAVGAEEAHEAEEEDPPLPPGFPKEDDFEGFLCYKCVEAYPWIKRYAGSAGFLPAVFLSEGDSPTEKQPEMVLASRKRKADDDAEAGQAEQASKRARSEVPAEEEAKNRQTDTKTAAEATATTRTCTYEALPPPPTGRFSLFFSESFRDHLCRCAACFPRLQPHPQLLEEEETYEPPVSEDGSAEGGGGSTGTGPGANHSGGGSLYDRGESALQNVDRVRAIEGVMAYNQLKDKLKPFFQQFADSGEAISAEDIKAYFAKLRGDEQAIREAGEAARSSGHRSEQSGY